MSQSTNQNLSARPRHAAPEASVSAASTSRSRSLALSLAAAIPLTFGALFFAGCDGSSGSRATGDETLIARPTLVSVDYGRLVDIYAYRRIDPSNPDRRQSRNRRPVLIERSTVISARVESQQLFDAIGGERPTANFRFLPFNSEVGHDELLILWDDTDPIEGVRFASAMAEAKVGLDSVPASYRNQPTSTRPIPVVPRNAAICLNFDSPIGLSSQFFDSNPNVVQLLQFIDDPSTVAPEAAFLPADYRVIANGNTLIIDTTLIGQESLGRRTSTGLAPSEDQVTANFRIAIPTSGPTSRFLSLSTDMVPELNDIDAQGNQAVIRDFRSGNVNDGRVGALSDESAPTIVGHFDDMGITSVDTAANVVTINKRGHLIAIRGRIPFVDGAVGPNGVPGGRSAVPTLDASLNRAPLASGDFVEQVVVSSVTGESVLIRAEVIENLDVGVELGDSNFAAPGLTAGGTDGGELPIARLRLSTVSATDSAGNIVSMVGDAGNPIGVDCRVRVRYYQNVPYSGEFGITASVSDAGRRAEFLVIDPAPNGVSTAETLRGAAPLSSIGIRFSEPMDTSSIDTLRDLTYSTEDADITSITAVLASPKSAGLSLLPSRLVDQDNDGTVLKLLAPLGFNHRAGASELYWLHASVSRVRDLAGNQLDLFDRRPPGQTQVSFRRNGTLVTEPIDTPLETFSVQFEMDPNAAANLVGTRSYRFEDADEDGSPPGSIDMFGQFRLSNGRLTGAATTRFSATVSDVELSGVARFDKGECVVTDLTATPPFSTTQQPPVPLNINQGMLYATPSMVSQSPLQTPTVFYAPGVTGSLTFGGVVEPHVRRGARQQMTYREDDFGLSYHDAAQLNIDIEQLHWAPWNDQPASFDTFDRYSLLLGHANKRPDLRFFLNDIESPAPFCDLDCGSIFSSLSTTFAANVLQNSSMKKVVDDATYTVNPALAFRTGNVTYVPYPPFEETFTWRDSRIVSWNMATNRVVGLGGAQDASIAPPAGDRTASVSSPWGPDMHEDNADGRLIDPDLWAGTQFVRDHADFRGDRTRDHDPIAMPLLVEVQNYPDDTFSTATSGNQFWIGYVGTPYAPSPQVPPGAPGGYYNLGPGFATGGAIPPNPVIPNCTITEYPLFRVHSTGGIDLLDGSDRLVYPLDNPVAIGGWLKDAGVGRLPFDGLHRTEPGDDHVYWAQADFVRRVSLVTFGFFDTQQPNRHALTPANYPSLPSSEGRPNFLPDNVRVSDFIAVLDPPVQLGGATAVVEVRGVNQIGPLGAPVAIYDPSTDDDPRSRGNLYNPNYACEAYRYANPSMEIGGTSVPRVEASGFTPYVELDEIDSIRNPQTGALPRFMNARLVLTNNIDASPNVSPSLRNLIFAYRMVPTGN